jgi:cytidylate kinase
MALVTISGAAGCRLEEIGRAVAQRLGFEFLDDQLLAGTIAEEFGSDAAIPDRAWPQVLGSIVTRLGTEHHMVLVAADSELLFKHFPGQLKVHVTAGENQRIGTIMVDRRLERPAAKSVLAEAERVARETRRKRFGRVTVQPQQFDLVVNADRLEVEQAAQIVESAARIKGIKEEGLVSPSAEAQMQFGFRMQLSRHGMKPPGNVKLKRAQFGHPSEEIFANLLDFYRIAWQYEARSFPIQWDKDDNVLEAFTPDFYLPEFDLYVELTTMKQAHVTRKNRKVKLLRAIYPHVNIQVFYQKDIQNLIFKHGLHERELAPAGARRR